MTRNVAVVAVHGVADQTPASSARSIADLLCTDKEYGSFSEIPLRIARERMEPGCVDEEKCRRDHQRGIDDAERQTPCPECLVAEKHCNGEHVRNADPGIRYMHDQLKEYRYPEIPRDEGTVYDTVRLEGKRLSDGARVHVHEVYWADLSRAGNTWYRLIAEFYQLILHLPSLGRNELAMAREMNGYTKPWEFAHKMQRLAVWLLTVPTALINVALLSIAIIALTAVIPGEYQYEAAFALTMVLTAAVLLAALRLAKNRKLLWTLWLPIVGIAAAAAYLILRGLDQYYQILALEAAVVAAGACIYIAKKYSVMKYRAFVFGVVAALAMLAIAIFFIWNKVSSAADVYVAAVATARTIYPALAVTWLLVFVTATLAAIAGVVAALTTEPPQRRLAWRALWTARFSLSMPAAVFVVLTLSIWYLVIEGIIWLGDEAPALVEARELLARSAQGLEFFALALIGFLIVALFAAVPSVLVEIRHPRSSDDDESARLGRWLTKGLRLVPWGAELFTVTMIAMLAVSVGMPTPLRGDTVMLVLGGVAGGVALLITGKYFVKTFRSLVDVMLDIDNYLRESPKDATPRARIAERYVSLLRHLAEWRDADGRPYDQIIIVAHSQGTVICADALRYLNTVPDRRLKAINDNTIPLRLFTMGSPLRQIYAQAFPHLYGWITEKDIIDSESPDPRRLTLQHWANVYCSGDYVGRNIWNAPEARLWARARPKPDGPRVDFCAGAGAHTHYWDRNATDVAAYLKELI